MSDPFAELLATNGVQEVSALRSRIGFMAYHGGSLEEQTDIIASRAADRSGASYYGVIQPADLQWHIPSHKVSPTSSAELKCFIEHVEIVMTIHGFGRRDQSTSVLLGGQNRDLAAHVATHLRPRLPDYDIVTELDLIPKDLRGLHPDNPVNLPPHKGVQIELPPRLRSSSPHTACLIDGLVDAAAMWPTPTAPVAR